GCSAPLARAAHKKTRPRTGQVPKAGGESVSSPATFPYAPFDPKACTFPLTQAGFLASGGSSTTAFPRLSRSGRSLLACRLQWRDRSGFAPDSLLAFRKRHLHQLDFSVTVIISHPGRASERTTLQTCQRPLRMAKWP